MAVVGAMMLESDASNKAIEILHEDHFYNTSHKHIYKSMKVLYKLDQAIDLMTTTEQLKKDKKLEEVGGSFYLTECINQVTTAANIEYHAKIILEKAILRELITIAADISQKGYEASKDALTILDEAEERIFQINQNQLKDGFESISPILHDTVDIIEKYQKRQGDVVGIPSGFAKLDEMTAGFQKADLIIVAGRPSMGKTALALSIARNAAFGNDFSVGFFSLEMSKFQLAMRLISSEAKIDSKKLRTGRLTNEEMRKVAMAANSLSEAPVFIDDSASLTFFELKSKARRLKKENNLDMIIVDYLQLMRPTDTKQNREQQISEISRNLKGIAKELDVPVMALSQLSRAPETRGEKKKPMLSDLRESGAIEQDADVVLFVYRPEVYEINTVSRGEREIETTNLAEIIIGKQRNGPTGAVDLTFLKDVGRFETMSYEEDIPF
ncbi:MAG: replicative DNA helicase [bacterium]|nr:replicative DNA helicase [bacterium]